MQPKLVINFQPLNEADFQTEAGTIMAGVVNNPEFPQPWHDTAPSIETLQAAYAAYLNAFHASLNRDRLKIAERDTARENLIQLFKYLANYLELVAKGDVAKLQTTGYKLRKDSIRGIHGGVLAAPADFKALHGPRSGNIQLHAAKLPGAKSYEVQMTEGDPAVASNWQPACTSANASHIEIEGLTPGHTYWFRIRALGTGGEGLLSDPISLMSL